MICDLGKSLNNYKIDLVFLAKKGPARGWNAHHVQIYVGANSVKRLYRNSMQNWRQQMDSDESQPLNQNMNVWATKRLTKPIPMHKVNVGPRTKKMIKNSYGTLGRTVIHHVSLVFPLLWHANYSRDRGRGLKVWSVFSLLPLKFEVWLGVLHILLLICEIYL